MLVTSVPGRLVRDPATRRIVDETPIEVDHTSPFWARLIADGDVEEAPESKPEADEEPLEPAHEEPTA